ncbi:MAG: hypothetical protein IJ727_03500 [Treponema sp.]|nr:hypothetical protein [Treponema sp.]
MDKVSVIQGRIFQKHIGSAFLRNGSLVTGRVLSKNSDGSYLLSLAGQKINVKSEHPLHQGQVFSAKVVLKEDRVILTLVNNDTDTTSFLKKAGADSVIAPNVASRLVELGLNANEQTLNLVLFMRQIGIKIDAWAVKKALQRAKGSENQEENAQLALLLDEKSISVDEEKVRAIFRRDYDRQKNQRHEEERQSQQGENKNILKASKMTAASVKDFFSQVDEAALSRRPGVLSAFNTVLSAKKNSPPLNHWLVFPFEWDFRQATGNIKMLFDSDMRKLMKVVVNVKDSVRDCVFVINYKNNDFDSVKFSSNDPSLKRKKNHLCALLSTMFHSKINIDFVDYDSLQGFCSSDECFFSVDGSL